MKSKKVAYIIQSICIAVFAMAAGVGIHIQYENQKTEGIQIKQFTFSNIEVTMTPIEVQKETPEELKEEEYYDSLEFLAMCVEAEAGNQDLLGKRMVADVILNRVDAKDFPNDIVSVITQPYHFTSYWDGRMNEVSISEETFKAVSMELEKRSYPDILYFTSEGYSKYGTPWKKIQGHYFSTK